MIRNRFLACTSDHSQLPLMAALANLPIVTSNDFDADKYVYDVPRPDGGSCSCGTWNFYSATCGGVYLVYTRKCGRTRTGRGVNTSNCPGTWNRILTGAVRINAHCGLTPSQAHPHT